jgi:hypothetical protein
MTIRAMQAFPPVIALLDSIQPPMQFGRVRRFFHGALAPPAFFRRHFQSCFLVLAATRGSS